MTLPNKPVPPAKPPHPADGTPSKSAAILEEVTKNRTLSRTHLILGLLLILVGISVVPFIALWAIAHFSAIANLSPQERGTLLKSNDTVVRTLNQFATMIANQPNFKPDVVQKNVSQLVDEFKISVVNAQQTEIREYFPSILKAITELSAFIIGVMLWLGAYFLRLSAKYQTLATALRVQDSVEPSKLAMIVKIFSPPELGPPPTYLPFNIAVPPAAHPGHASPGPPSTHQPPNSTHPT